MYFARKSEPDTPQRDAPTLTTVSTRKNVLLSDSFAGDFRRSTTDIAHSGFSPWPTNHTANSLKGPQASVSTYCGNLTGHATIYSDP